MLLIILSAILGVLIFYQNRNILRAHLQVKSLAEELQVSRTPISVSLSALERDGYVVVQPQRGTFVRELTPFELEIIFKARASLGKLVIEMCRTFN